MATTEANLRIVSRSCTDSSIDFRRRRGVSFLRLGAATIVFVGQCEAHLAVPCSFFTWESELQTAWRRLDRAQSRAEPAQPLRDNDSRDTERIHASYKLVIRLRFIRGLPAIVARIGIVLRVVPAQSGTLRGQLQQTRRNNLTRAWAALLRSQVNAGIPQPPVCRGKAT